MLTIDFGHVKSLVFSFIFNTWTLPIIRTYFVTPIRTIGSQATITHIEIDTFFSIFHFNLSPVHNDSIYSPKPLFHHIHIFLILYDTVNIQYS